MALLPPAVRLIPREEFSRRLWPQPLCLDCRFLHACHRMLTVEPEAMAGNFWMIWADGRCARRHQENTPPAAVTFLRYRESARWHEMLRDGDAQFAVDSASTDEVVCARGDEDGD